MAKKRKKKTGLNPDLAAATELAAKLEAENKELKEQIKDLQDSMPDNDEIVCEFCFHIFDRKLGRFGCPNCRSEDLESAKTIGFLAVSPKSTASLSVYRVIPGFGETGPALDLKSKLKLDPQAIGFRIRLLNGDPVFVPFDG